MEISAGINTSGAGKFGGNNPFINGHNSQPNSVRATTAQKSKASELIAAMEEKRKAKPTKAEEKESKAGGQKKKKK